MPVKNEFPQQRWIVDQALRGTSIRDNNSDVMFNNLMNKFTSGNANKPGVYFDEENRRHLLSVRSVFAEAAGNLADKQRSPEAIKLLDKSESLLSTQNFPYAMTSRYNSHNQTAMLYLEAAYKAGYKPLAQKLKTAINKDLSDQKAYYDYLKTEKEDFYLSMAREADINDFMIQLLETIEKNYNTSKVPVQENPKRAADSTGIK